MATRYTQELLDRATAYVEQPLDQRRPDGLSEISQLVADITGEANGGCRQCQYIDYLGILKNYIRAATRFIHPETMAESKYSIAPGLENEQFVHEGLSQAITAENLTDQAAEFLIKHGFKHAFVLKSGEKASAEGEGSKSDADSKPSAAETKAKADLTAEKTAHKTTKDALKAEKDGHTATKKELTAV